MRYFLLLLCCLPVFSMAQWPDSIPIDSLPEPPAHEHHKKAHSHSNMDSLFAAKLGGLHMSFLFNDPFFNTDAHNMSVLYTNAAANFQVNRTLPVSNNFTLGGAGIDLGYQFGKHLDFNTRLVSNDVDSLYLLMINLGLSWKMKLFSAWDHNVYVTPGIDYSFILLRNELGNYDNPNKNLVINGATFTNTQVTVGLQTNQTALTPRIGISVDINPWIALFGEAGVFVPVGQHSTLRFQETDTSVDDEGNDNSTNLIKKMPLANTAIDFRKDNQPSTEMPYHLNAFFNIGVRFQIPHLSELKSHG